MKNYTKQIIERNIESLSIELKSLWSNSDMVNKYTMDFIDNLSDVNHTVFNRIYKNIDGNWSKSSLAGELIKGNLKKIINSVSLD